MHSSVSTSIVFGVSSVGLGHARRSLAIANKLRSLCSDIEIDWLCAEPAAMFLTARGEKILDVSEQMISLSSAMEEQAGHGGIRDMSIVVRKSSALARKNFETIKPVLKNYNVLVQDEFVETLFSFMWDRDSVLPQKKVAVTDYVRFETQSVNPANRVVLWYANRLFRKAFLQCDKRIFADDIDSIPEGSIRSWAEKNFEIVGPVLEDLPAKEKEELRKELFRDIETENVLVFSIGGTSIGRSLLEFVIRHSQDISRDLDATLIVLSGPRAKVSQNIESKNLMLVDFTPEAMRYFKAADCVVTQAGASTLNEVAALGGPCVIVPIENHWEQKQNAERFSGKFGFQVLRYSDLSKENLIRSIRKSMETPIRVAQDVDGSKKTARLIASLL